VEKHVALFEYDRRRKLETVAKALGYDSVFPMLNYYKTREVVPGICTRFGCDYIRNVERNDTAIKCDNCRHTSVQSILIIARWI
jgi:hypothetical protein